jgi:hypothetical protein
MKEILIRVLVGGVVVTAFTLLADLLKPKSFAGIFGAAPSVALATLVLTVMMEGTAYAATEARSMIVGAIAFFFYACLVSRSLVRWQLPVLPVTILSMLLWFSCAFGLCYGLGWAG